MQRKPKQHRIIAQLNIGMREGGDYPVAEHSKSIPMFLNEIQRSVNSKLYFLRIFQLNCIHKHCTNLKAD